MKSMALDKQMDLFQEGGMIDEGGDTDPISGNDVPVGSLKKEVRDDIPAQLSEGEFVMPADVVRYHGLDKMMALRDEAKMGLQRMEAMGQMGNADEAIIPDGVPFNMNDLEVEDEPMEMQVGGFVPSVQNQFGISGFQPSQFGTPQPSAMPAPQPFPSPMPTGLPQYVAPTQAFTPTAAPTSIPSFQEFIQPPAGMAPEIRVYINPQTGEERQITFINNQPTVPIPDGFILKSEYTAPTAPAPTTPTVSQSTQQQQEDRISPEELAQQQQAQQNIKERKAAAKKLGYTKEANPLEGLLGALIPGAALFGVGSNQEAGTIMPDGTISDGQGNTFDPITGKQMGGKGFLGLGKSEAEKFGLSEQIPESSFAGLRSMAGEESIQDVIGKKAFQRITGIDLPAEEKDPTDVAVETTQVTAEPATTVTEAAKTEYKGIGTDPLTGDIIPPLDGNTAAGIIEVGSPEQMLAELSKENPSLPVVRALADLRAQASGQYSNYDEGDVQFARSALKYFEEEGRIPKEDTPVIPTRKTTFAPIDTEGVVEEETRIQQTRVARNQRIQEEAEEQTQNYRNRGYSETAAKQAGQNKARADDEAREQTGEPQAKAVTDKYGNPVRSGSDGSVVTSNREQKDDSPEPDRRWCCSQMVHRGLWTQQYEFARLTVWSSKQPDWWKSGYHVWGKVLAKTFLRKKGFWTDVMQSFYDYHIRKKPYTWRTALAHVMVYPGVFICGNIWTKQPKGVTLASFKELNG
jgi:hypothetical protein